MSARRPSAARTTGSIDDACRDMNKYDNARGARVTDALLNYETVKVFGNEEYERNELDQCIMKYQDVEYKLMASLNGLNVLQSIIIFSGLIAGLMVCVKVCYDDPGLAQLRVRHHCSVKCDVNTWHSGLQM